MTKEDLEQSKMLKRKLSEPYLIHYKMGIITLEELLMMVNVSLK